MTLDEQELRAFFAHGYDRLVGRLDGWHRRAWAEDLVQEALVRAWERARRGETVGSLPAWVTTVATNLARSRLRREQAERRAIERLAATWPGWVPDWPGGAAEEAEVLRELVERLPRRQREVVVLRYVADLDLASIAELLGIDVGTVKSSLSRGRRAVARALTAATVKEREAGTMGLRHWGMLSAETGSHEIGLAGEAFEGRPVAYLRSTGEPAESFGLLFQGIAADDYRGRRVRLSAALRANGVTGYAGLWLRVEGGRPSGTLAFDDMHGRHLTGTTGWREHANVLDVAVEADRIMLGAILSGEGELLLSGVAFEEVDERVPVTGPELPRRPRNLGFEES
jgi:RNA polymerase sigma factor (sigma-70 family)